MTLQAQHVTFEVARQPILRNVSADFEVGQFTALIGPNGAGKSSLLRILAGDIEPSAGSVKIENTNLESLSLMERAKLRAVMTQSTTVVFDFLVEEIIEFGWLGAQEQLLGVMQEVVQATQLQPMLGRCLNTLSGGEQQRVQFARALMQIWPTANNSRYLLLDEPTSSLDVAHELNVLCVAKKIATKSLGVVVVLHDLNLAARFADRLVLMNQGEVVIQGCVEEVLESELLSDVYGTQLRVEHHGGLNRVVVYS